MVRVTGEAYVQLKFSPSFELIPIVRRFVSSFYLQLLKHEDMASRMALATHELLENTVKYSTDGESSINISVMPAGDGREIVIRTLNRASDSDRENAVRIVDEVRSNPDAIAYYQAIMRRNARRRDGSGLGLARVCAEADMRLACAVADDGRLSMEARALVPAPEAQP